MSSRKNCRMSIPAGTIAGVPCPNCGHNNLLHPGAGNPAIIECLACDWEAKLDEMSELTLALSKVVTEQKGKS